MTVNENLKRLREDWLERVPRELAEREGVRAGFQELLVPFFHLMERSLETGEPIWMDSLLAEWVIAPTETQLEAMQNNSVEVISHIFRATNDLIREILNEKEALDLLSALLPIFNHSMEFISIQEIQFRVKHITNELNQARMVVEKLEKTKSDFISVAAHELKTPLIPISGYAELFLDGSLGNITELQREKMQVMYENSIRLTTLIQDILDARKVELKRLNLNIQVESIKEIAKRCIDIFRPIAEPKGIRLVDETQDIMIKCDPERILQVFNNVISNALKFVPAQYGTISINSRIDNDTVMISIKDNGIGIPKQKQEDLFKKFYQVDKTLTRKSGGTGLGLAISRGIIEAHGGKIWVESEENQGTTVHFTIQKGDSN